MPITEKQVWEALPPRGILRRYVTYGVNCTDANAAYHLAGGLTLLANTTPTALTINFGTSMRANIFTLLYGQSTDSRKTTAVRIARSIQQQVDERKVGDEPGSQEGLVESVRANPCQTIYYEEFGNFLAKCEEGFMRPIKTAFNTLADSGVVSRSLAASAKAKIKTSVDGVRLSLLCGCAPVYLEQHADYMDWVGGFLARFFVLDAGRERFIPSPIGAPDLEKDLVDALKAKQAFGEHGLIGRHMGMTPDALGMWTAYANDVEALRHHADEAVLGALSRSQQITMKIAGLLAWDYGQACSAKDWWITADEMTWAMAIVKLHVQSAIGIGQTLAMDKDMRDRRRVLAVINDVPARLGEVLGRSKLLKGRGRQILDTLLEEGAVEAVSINGRQMFRRSSMLAAQEDASMRWIAAIGTGRVADMIREHELLKATEGVTNVVQLHPAQSAGPLSQTAGPIGPVIAPDLVERGISVLSETDDDRMQPAMSVYDPNAPTV